MPESRTKKTVRNTVWGFLEKFVQILLPFITRTLILKLIGEQYLGLNGLFTSVISVLNLADLGFGAAITYSMYKPIAENDTRTLCAILNFYKKTYRIIGLAILFVGVILMPFLPYIIKGDVPSDINIYLLYTIYLANTVLSYLLFAYKTSLLHAYHRDDVKSKIAVTLLFFQYSLQIVLLLGFNNYYVYVMVLPVITLISNILTAVATKKMYCDVVCKGEIGSEITKKIKKQVSGAFISKVCGVTRNSLDSIFISSFLGLTQVAIYSNYYYILGAVHNFMTVITNSMIGGVGNSIVEESLDKNYKDFRKFTFLYSWLAGWFACCMLCLYQPFMCLWVGDSLMLPFGTMVLFCIYLYIISASDIKNVYYTARGLWWEGRIRALLEVAVNFVLNFIGAKFLGVFGIVLATIITMIFINFLYDTRILFKHYFTNASMSYYIRNHLFYFIVTVVVSGITYLACSLLPDRGLVYLFIKAVICLLLPNVLYFVAYFKTKVFGDVKPLFINILIGLKGKFCR